MLKDVVITYKGKYLGTYRGTEKDLKKVTSMFALQGPTPANEHREEGSEEDEIDTLLNSWDFIVGDSKVKFVRSAKMDLSDGTYND